MKTTRTKWVALGAVLCNMIMGSAVAQAQPGSGVGGGKFSEAQIAIFYGRLTDYFGSDEWPAVFPEVTRYNEDNSHPDFIDLMRSVTFKVVNHKVYYNGEERDCVPMLRDNIRWIECDAASIPENTLDNQPILYSFLLHEIFVYAGIEEAKGKWVPSTYEKSWRMADEANLSLVVQKVWMPGKKKRKDPTVSELGLICLSRTFKEMHWHHEKAIAFVWRPDGNWVLFEHHVPALQAEYGYQQSQVTTRAQWNRLRLVHGIARAIGRQVTSQVIARGRNPIDQQRGSNNASISNRSEHAFGKNSFYHVSLNFEFRVGEYARDWTGATPLDFSAELLHGKGWYRNQLQVSCKPYTDWEAEETLPIDELLRTKPGQKVKQEVIEKLGKYQD